ncbi:hypothetical protein IFM89_018884 [Coptis chinensis]|uniref:Uncharacterized protein n=1 Tax=Coptis chinensis TaxID=261450 RepID=A0A835HG04_9MAGN|nr:hypothetical protein IFM89_018884 [Coptis chinensis]
MTIDYDVMEISFFYGEEFLCGTYFSPFNQEKRKENFLKVRFKTVEDRVLNLISGDRKRGMVRLNVEASGWIKVKSRILKTKHHLMEVICKDVMVKFNSSTGLGAWAGHEKCRVDT